MANTLKIKRGTAATIPQGQLAEPLFTTDTYDLYIGKGSGGNQRIQNYIASGTSSQFLKGDGTLDSTSYQPLITAGTTLQYYRGDKTFQTLDTSVVPENGPIYFTEPRVRATVLTGLNLSGGGTIAATDSILTAFGKVQNQISALVGGATYQGTWNASTNTPTLASGTGTKGYYYVVSVAGSTNLDGITDWKIGDWAIFNGTTWDKVDNTDAVSSVNGFTGAVNLALDNISDVSAASPTNAQLLRFNGTSSLWENWTPTFEPALTKGNLTSGDTSYLTVSGGTGAVIGSGTTISILASGIVNGGLTLTTTGNSGAATKTFATLNIPNYTLAGLGGVPTTRTITINGTAQDLSADRSWSVGTITGSGTASYVPKFTGASAIGNSQIVDDGTSILIGVTSDQGILQINGAPAGGLMINASDSQFGIAFKNSSSSNKKWDFSPQGNNLQFNESGVAPVLIFKAGGGNNVRLYSYASNGFLKTSSSDGTLIVDTTSYLPLTGGTLTGALSGTSATFTLNQNASTWVKVANTDTGAGAAAGVLFANDGGDRGAISILSSGNSPANALFIRTLSTNSLILGANGGQHLSIASTGATTFSGSVGVTGFTTKTGNGLFFNFGASSANQASIQSYDWGASVFRSLLIDALDFNVSTNGSSRLTISSTGAATFSSSVTATGGLISNGGSIGYGGGELGFNVTTSGATSGIYTTTPGSPILYFDHRATGNTGFWVWRSGTGGGTTALTLSNAGAATFSSSVTAANTAFGASGGYIITYGGNASSRSWRLATDINAFGDFSIQQSTTRTGTTYADILNFNASGAATFSSSVTGGNFYIPAASAGTYGLADLSAAIQTYSGSISPANSILFWTNGSERMRIKSDGNVGIGSTSAGYKLTLTASSAANADIFLAGMTGVSNGFTVQRVSSSFVYSMNDGNLTIGSGSIKTGAPAGGTAKPWKLGARLSGTVSTSTTNYLEVEVDGTLYYLAFAVPL